MKLTPEIIPTLKLAGLVIVSEKSKLKASIHGISCSVAVKAFRKLDAQDARGLAEGDLSTWMDNTDTDALYLLGQGYSVTLCKCSAR